MPSALFNGFLGDFDDLAVEFAQSIDSLQKAPSEETFQSTVEEALKSEDKDAVVRLLVTKSILLHTAPEKSKLLYRNCISL
jgi:hypothetical protein